jgi:DNA-binding transcriptional MerR regulator
VSDHSQSADVQYRVDQLAAAAGVPVDTVRFYQAQGLLARPRRVGRHAIYGPGHLARLRRIRKLKHDGLPLAVIRRMLAPGARTTEAALLRALDEARGTRALSRAELAAEADVPEALLHAVESAGIVEPLRLGDRARYAEADVEMARAALRLLRGGFPLQDLLALALRHAEHVRDVTDDAIGLFDRHVRRDQAGRERDPDAVVAAFRQLLPAVTGLVAHHFQRTLVARAIGRLERDGDRAGLRHALRAASAGRLEITWR